MTTTARPRGDRAAPGWQRQLLFLATWAALGWLLAWWCFEKPLHARRDLLRVLVEASSAFAVVLALGMSAAARPAPFVRRLVPALVVGAVLATGLRDLTIRWHDGFAGVLGAYAVGAAALVTILVVFGIRGGRWRRHEFLLRLALVASVVGGLFWLQVPRGEWPMWEVDPRASSIWYARHEVARLGESTLRAGLVLLAVAVHLRLRARADPEPGSALRLTALDLILLVMLIGNCIVLLDCDEGSRHERHVARFFGVVLIAVSCRVARVLARWSHA